MSEEIGTITRSDFVREYAQALSSGSGAAFLGSGLSIPAGYPTWEKLLAGVAEELGLDVSRESLTDLAQYYANTHGEDAFRRRVADGLKPQGSDPRSVDTPTATHHALTRLPFATVWTTNYDRLIERTYEDDGFEPVVMAVPGQLVNQPTKPGPHIAVYKMHGSSADEPSIVLTRSQYDEFRHKRRAFLTLLTSHFLTYNFLILGFGFRDPNFDFVLAELVGLTESGGRCHYAVTARPGPQHDQSDADYQQTLTAFRLQLQDLRKRYRILTVVLDSHDDYAALLTDVSRAVNVRRVLVSGSIQDRRGTVNVNDLCVTIGRCLIEHDFEMVTGTARELREPLLEGAVGALTEGDPIRPSEPVMDVKFLGKRKSDWKEKVRKTMARNVSFAILIGGADGTKRELDYGSEWIEPIPIRATGGFADEAWDAFRARWKDSHAARQPAFDDLERSSDGVTLGKAAVSFIADRRREIKRELAGR